MLLTEECVGNVEINIDCDICICLKKSHVGPVTCSE